jgi:hypothetical protein
LYSSQIRENLFYAVFLRFKSLKSYIKIIEENKEVAAENIIGNIGGDFEGDIDISSILFICKYGRIRPKIGTSCIGIGSSRRSTNVENKKKCLIF